MGKRKSLKREKAAIKYWKSAGTSFSVNKKNSRPSPHRKSQAGPLTCSSSSSSSSRAIPPEDSAPSVKEEVKKKEAKWGTTAQQRTRERASGGLLRVRNRLQFKWKRRLSAGGATPIGEGRPAAAAAATANKLIGAPLNQHGSVKTKRMLISDRKRQFNIRTSNSSATTTTTAWAAGLSEGNRVLLGSRVWNRRELKNRQPTTTVYSAPTVYTIYSSNVGYISYKTAKRSEEEVAFCFQ